MWRELHGKKLPHLRNMEALAFGTLLCGTELAPSNSFGSWIFKRILAERTTILQWIRIYPGDGTDINFWHDPWTKFGQLLFLFGQNGPRQTGIPITLHLRWLAIGSMVHGTSALLDHSIWRTSSLISPPSPSMDDHREPPAILLFLHCLPVVL